MSRKLGDGVRSERRQTGSELVDPQIIISLQCLDERLLSREEFFLDEIQTAPCFAAALAGIGTGGKTHALRGVNEERQRPA